MAHLSLVEVGLQSLVKVVKETEEVLKKGELKEKAKDEIFFIYKIIFCEILKFNIKFGF